MHRTIPTFIFALVFSAFACSSAAGALPQAVSATNPALTATEYSPTAPPVTPTYAGCAYVWGSQDLPELTHTLNAELQKIGPDLTGLAYAYGENCVYADGHQTFGAMETDFRIGVKVSNVRDQGTMGNWIYKVMQIVIALPPEQLQGPQRGRVDFDFKVPDPQDLYVTVPIDKYLKEADNLRGTELFQLFYKAP